MRMRETTVEWGRATAAEGRGEPGLTLTVKPEGSGCTRYVTQAGGGGRGEIYVDQKL